MFIDINSHETTRKKQTQHTYLDAVFFIMLCWINPCSFNVAKLHHNNMKW
jgi:hypothetical protein